MVTVADRPTRAKLYAKVADTLRTSILTGQYPPGLPLPSEDRLAARHVVSRDTIRSALAMLRAEGLISTVQGGATYVRDRRAVRLPVSRYSRTFNAGLPAPFQAAAAESGLTGSVKVVEVYTQRADDKIAERLDVAPGADLIGRVRHMRLGDAEPETVQISTSMIPLALIEGTALAEPGRIPSGVYEAFAEIGHVPTTMTEEVSARMPSPQEAEALGLAAGQPVLVAERVTKDQDDRPIELVRVVATADRSVFVYDDLPISRADLPAD